MSPQYAQSVVAVTLDNLVQQSLPRVFAIRHKLDQGSVLNPFELEFFTEMLDRINQCQRQALNDHECQIIFATVAHLLFSVINQAMENEKKQQSAATAA